MILITSGAFVSTELQVELGKLPPALMPLGNKRLYQHQVEVLRASFPHTDIYLSIPDTYTLHTTDDLLLRKLDVNIILVPDGLSLGGSLLYVINTIGRYDEILRILHGDTYLCTIPLSEDVVALADAEDEYQRKMESCAASSTSVWCGYFAFSNIRLLARSLSAARGEFVEAVRLYQSSQQQQFEMVYTWQDMGHVNTYFRTRAKFTTQRSFNDLCIENGVVRKSSKQFEKIRAEANWFVSLPHSLKRYTPQFIRQGLEDGSQFYELEYLPHLPLNELFVHCNLPQLFWRRIFNLAGNTLNNFQYALELTDLQKEKIQYDYTQLVTEKTFYRLSEFVIGSGYGPGSLLKPTSLNGKTFPSLKQIALDCQAAALQLPALPGVSHGDFCFSNILYDSRSDVLKLLDPRGFNAHQELTIFGDLRYDVAKFIHSVIGLYDHIIAGLYTLHESASLRFEFEIHQDERVINIQQSAYNNISFLGINVHQIMPVVILLFLSMLPLHVDKPERQKALLANALRLYALWREA